MTLWLTAALDSIWRRSGFAGLAGLWGVAVTSYAYVVLKVGRGSAVDVYPYWHAASAYVRHRAPYEQEYATTNAFIYAPSALPFFAPLGLLPFSEARILFLAGEATAVLVAGALCLQIVELRWRSAAGAVLLLALSLFEPVRAVLWFENVDGYLVLGEAIIIVAVVRGRWAVAGAVLGVLLAIKAVLAPLLLLPLIWREWRALAIALALPFGLLLVGMVSTASGQQFLTVVIPYMLHGVASKYGLVNVSLSGIARLLGVPSILATLLSIAVLIAVVWVLRLNHRSATDERVRLVEASAVVMLAATLCLSFGWAHYAFYLLPAFVAVVLPGSSMRNWAAALGVVAVGGPDIRFWGQLYWTLVPVRVTAGLLLLLAVLAFGIWKRSRPTSTVGAPIGSNPTHALGTTYDPMPEPSLRPD